MGGLYRCTTHPATARQGADPVTAKRAPEAPAGLEWVVTGAGTVPFARDPVSRCARAVSPPFGPGQAPAGPSLGYTPPRAKRARFQVISWKLSKNREVSPKYVEKACHSPYIPKRCPKVTSWNSQIPVFLSLLSQGINGPFWPSSRTLLSK